MEVASSSPASHRLAAGDPPALDLQTLQHVIDHAAHYLPAQGPITVFIHHNTLHALEELPFDQAVARGARIFGCEPYLPEHRFREYLAKGRIRIADLESVIDVDLGERGSESILGLTTRQRLRLAMLQFPLRHGTSNELRWFIAETDARRRLRRDCPATVREQMIERTRRWVTRAMSERAVQPAVETYPPLAHLLASHTPREIERWTPQHWEEVTVQTLWRVCREGVRQAHPSIDPGPEVVRLRDWVLAATGVDIDLWVNPLLIRFCAAFLDQGMSAWPLPDRERGFLAAFSAVYAQSWGPPDPWVQSLPDELARIRAAGLSPLQLIAESLADLGVFEFDWEIYISRTLLALRGWAGMLRQVETRGDRVAHRVPEGTLAEFLAVRLLLERLALRAAAATVDVKPDRLADLWSLLEPRSQNSERRTHEQRAFQIFQIAEILGWSPEELSRLSIGEWHNLIGEIEAFGDLERRRVFHLAFERKYRHQILDSLSQHARSPIPPTSTPRFQFMTCIDEREESFRRHLEELCPDSETFGAAGFFSVPMYFRGAADAHFVPLCPVVIRPQHWITEEPAYSLADSHRRRQRTRRAFGRVSHQFHLGSRTFIGGVATALIGVVATIPLVARILFPRLSARLRDWVSGFFQPPPVTELRFERTAATAGPADDQLGLSVDEMTAFGERLLRDLGMTSRFGRLVVVFGHGSTSMNNPHKSAYDCGACGGSSGGPNARAIALILNDARVREQLIQRGLEIPISTHFVGAFHNTCNDSVTYFDLDEVPRSHRRDFEAARDIIEQATERNAHERCRRFQSAALTLTFHQAKQHVEERSEDLGQTRPECGHATNAICVIGRRFRTRGLFLDRRAFLVSYDPTQDTADAAILTRILLAIGPVCSGINLEYYFSYIDSQGWGCGTKLPHNLTSLLGVMDGAASDLRTGLPWQMVEIHEPMRLLVILETEPATVLGILAAQPAIARLFENGWVQVVTLSPSSAEMHVLKRGRFEPYEPRPAAPLARVPTSGDWYRGWRDHLDCAQITGQLATEVIE